MAISLDQLVERIHDAPTRIVLAAAGGGSRAIADLLETPGASRTLLEAVVPYSARAMTDWLGGPPDEACSSVTGRAMAVVAFQRARRFEEQDVPPAGVACTASLASDRPKRGPHRIHVALQTAALTAAWHLELQKGRRTRAEEERLAGRLTLNVVAEACGVADRLPLDLLEGERVEESRTIAAPDWQELFLGETKVACNIASFLPVGEESRDSVPHPSPLPREEGTSFEAIFPGAFNPLHAGHRRMIEIAQATLRQPVAVEISIENVDKPPLDYMEMERRLKQFPSEQAVLFSRAATFVEKSRLFAGATFVVGVDTLRRIALPRYYGGAPNAREEAIDAIAATGCRFLVFGRDTGQGFVRLAALDLPERLKSLCREIPPEVFREDISSTAIRNGRTV